MARAIDDIYEELMTEHALRVEEIASRAEVGVSTTKLALKKLLEEGNIQRTLIRQGGAGRPAWLYTRLSNG